MASSPDPHRRRASVAVTRRPVLGAGLSILVALGVVSLVSPASGAPTPGPDVEVSVLDGRKCRPFTEHLPALFSVGGIQPGERTPRVDVCVRNGGHMAARLTLGVFERVESEAGCTGDEPDIDLTCGGAQVGELGGNLVVLVISQPDCRGPTSTVEVNLVALESVPAVLNPSLRPNRTDCLGLQVEHRPMSDEAAAAAQTDTVLWRFAFDLST
jgi:hypothetical protein